MAVVTFLSPYVTIYVPKYLVLSLVAVEDQPFAG